MTGKIKWTYLCDSLHAVGCSGDLSFETFQQARATFGFDEEMLLPWLTLICKTGECFRKHIQQSLYACGNGYESGCRNCCSHFGKGISIA